MAPRGTSDLTVDTMSPVTASTSTVSASETIRSRSKAAQSRPRKSPKPSSPRPKTQMHRPLQALFLYFIFAPQIIFFLGSCGSFCCDPLREISSWVEPFTAANLQSWFTSRDFLLVVAALAFERICYTFVWFFPSLFQRVSETPSAKVIAKNPVDLIVRAFFYPSKVLQMGSFLVWYLRTAAPVNFWDISGYSWMTALQCIVVGQILNAGIYRAIGKAGVYYGFKYGYDIPWCTGFPFNVCTAHPQYFGATLTCFGFVILLSTPAHLAAGWTGLALMQAIMYAYMAVVEST